MSGNIGDTEMKSICRIVWKDAYYFFIQMSFLVVIDDTHLEKCMGERSLCLTVRKDVDWWMMISCHGRGCWKLWRSFWWYILWYRIHSSCLLQWTVGLWWLVSSVNAIWYVLHLPPKSFNDLIKNLLTSTSPEERITKNILLLWY